MKSLACKVFILSAFLFFFLVTTATAQTLTVKVPRGNVRAGPGLTYDIVGKVTRGQEYPIEDRQGDWFKIHLEPGKEGWLYTSLVQLSTEPQSPGRKAIPQEGGRGTPEEAPSSSAAHTMTTLFLILLVASVIGLIRSKKRRRMYLCFTIAFFILFSVSAGQIEQEKKKGIVTSQLTKQEKQKLKPTKEKKQKSKIALSSKARVKEVDMPKYSVLDENIVDTPIKTEITLNLLVSGEISDDGLRILLNKLYFSTKGRRGFRYHKSPTNIYIYAYTSKERAEAGMGQWVAMLQKGYDELRPTIRINPRQLAQLGAKPEERFELSEAKRIQIWNEIIKVEDRTSYSRSLMGEAKNELARKYGLTRRQLDMIAGEGLRKDWPFPKQKEQQLKATMRQREKETPQPSEGSKLAKVCSIGKQPGVRGGVIMARSGHLEEFLAAFKIMGNTLDPQLRTGYEIIALSFAECLVKTGTKVRITGFSSTSNGYAITVMEGSKVGQSGEVHKSHLTCR